MECRVVLNTLFNSNNVIYMLCVSIKTPLHHKSYKRYRDNKSILKLRFHFVGFWGCQQIACFLFTV